IPWLKQRYGSFVAYLFRSLFLLYAYLICLLTVKETVMWTHSMYLPRTPNVVLAIALVMLCIYAAYSGVKSIAIASGMLLPFVIVFGDFVMSSNLPEKDYSMLMPMLEHGITPVLEGLLFVGGGLAELLLILLVQHHFKSKVKLWMLILLGMFLIMLIIGPLTGAIVEFGPEIASRMRYPAYEEWRLVRLGKYIQHVDFLSIYQWM